MRFEYLSIELPSLKTHLTDSKLSQSHKDVIVKHLTDRQDLDVIGLSEVISEIELVEKMPNYSDIIKRAST